MKSWSRNDYDGWDKYLPQFDIIIIQPYINRIPEKTGSSPSYQNLVLRLVSAKKNGFSQQNLWWSSFATIRKKKPPKTCKKLIKTHKNP